MTAVTIPVRFGTTRIGLVQGGKLAADGLDYPQPGGENWQKGTVTVQQGVNHIATADEFGFQPEALISGGGWQLYGQDIDGWVYLHESGNWLIQPQLISEGEDGGDKPSFPYMFADGLTLPCKITQFGVFGGAAGKTTTVNATLSDWGQDETTNRLFVCESGSQFVDCADDGACADGGWLALVSCNKAGTKAIFMVYLPVDRRDLIPCGATASKKVRAFPMGYLECSVSWDPAIQEFPSLSMAVLYDRETTLGEFSCDDTVPPLATELLFTCPMAPPDTDTELYCGTVGSYGPTYSGITDMILAAYYNDGDVVETILGSLGVTGTVEIEEVELYETFPVDRWRQASQSKLVWEWSLTRGATTLTWGCTTEQQVVGYLTCGGESATESRQSADTTEIDGKTHAGEWDIDYTFNTYNMPLATIGGAGCWYGISTFGRSVDDWTRQIYVYGDDPFSFQFDFYRYAYGVIGIVAVKVTEVTTSNFFPGPVISPVGTIARSEMPSSLLSSGDITVYYGTYDPRTNTMLVNTTANDPVCYV